MSNTRILIVEDEEIVAMSIEYALLQLGYVVTAVVPSGEAAIQKAGETDPDLILMDVRLVGQIDGIEAANQIRSEFDLPVIFLTAYADHTTLQRAKLSEPYGYLLKPFEEIELHTAIEMAVYKHQLERNLRAQKQWLDTTLRSIGDAVITADVAGRITFMNLSAERLTGWSEREALGHGLADVCKIVVEETGELIDNLAERISQPPFSLSLDRPILLISKDQRRISVIESIARIQDEIGNCFGVVLVLQNNTERRTAERILAEERNLLRTVIDNIPDYIYVKDRQSRFVLTNRASVQVLGAQSAEEVIGRSDQDFYPPDLAGRYYADEQMVIESGEPMLDREEPHVNPGGVEGFLLTTKVPLRDTDQQVVGVVGIGRDITEQKKAAEEREQLITDLQTAMARIKTLHGLIPICASCKKIRDDHGYWHQVETYVAEHSDAQFSHGLCPDCFEHLYPDFFKADTDSS